VTVRLMGERGAGGEVAAAADGALPRAPRRGALRKDREIECLEIIQRAWQEDNFSYKGKFYDIQDVTVVPQPVQHHRRDDMDQAEMVAAHGKDLGDDVFLANVLLGNVFDGDASRTGQFGSAVAHPITKRFGKSRIVEDPDLPRRKKPHHALRIAGPGQRAGDDDPVVAGNPATPTSPGTTNRRIALYLRPDTGKCLHYYFYFIDAELGLI
jgi:hypothetical protein